MAGLVIEAAEPISGTFLAPNGTRLDTPPVCRVRGVARPTPSSRITFELWLPRSGWNGRYSQLGNGGFAGNIHFPSLAADAARGNAVAATDTGHEGDGFDASWAAGHPQRVLDYGYRSIKATSDAARAIVSAYYGRPPSYRYFAGCSNGGRQALMAAQRYAEDWDGILVGAPANMWTRQLTQFAAIQHRLRAVPGAWIPASKLPAIQRAALATCPAGSVMEGVALNPEKCRFDPQSMRCGTVDKDDCLTQPQAASVAFLRSSGYEPTSAAVPDAWDRWIVNPDPAAQSQLAFAQQAFRYLLDDRPQWTVRDFGSRFSAGADRLRPVIDSDSARYDRFRAKGGKIISYFGWADAVIAPHKGVEYYRRVVKAAGGGNNALDFYRLFMVPGMTHCQGGAGPTAFGQSITAPASLPDRHHDVRTALESWVERGIAPDFLIASGTAEAGSLAGASTRTLWPLR